MPDPLAAFGQRFTSALKLLLSGRRMNTRSSAPLSSGSTTAIASSGLEAMVSWVAFILKVFDEARTRPACHSNNVVNSDAVDLP